MNVKPLLTSLATCLILCGCGKQQSAPTNGKESPQQTSEKEKTPPPINALVQSWESERDRLDGLVKVGMTEDEVTKLIGEPKRSRSIVGVTTLVTWEYNLSQNRQYRVRFDGRGKVIGTECVDPMRTSNRSIPIQ